MIYLNKRWLSLYRFRKNEQGFTLVELLIVVGIIVALAGVVIPNVVAFNDRGLTGAMAEELDVVQSAMDYMMVEVGAASVNASPSQSKNNWDTFPNGDDAEPLVYYLQEDASTYYYCWEDNGKITQQNVIASPCP